MNDDTTPDQPSPGPAPEPAIDTAAAVRATEPPVDPARAWASEHYGFDDGTPPAAAAETGAQPTRLPRLPRGRVVVAGAVLGLLVAGGAGGAALAAAGGGGGDDSFSWFDGGAQGPGDADGRDGDGRGGRGDGR